MREKWTVSEKFGRLEPQFYSLNRWLHQSSDNVDYDFTPLIELSYLGVIFNLSKSVFFLSETPEFEIDMDGAMARAR